MSVIRVRRHRSGVIDQGVRSSKPSWLLFAGTAKDGATIMRISEGHPPLKYARPRGGFNTIRDSREERVRVGESMPTRQWIVVRRKELYAAA